MTLKKSDLKAPWDKVLRTPLINIKGNLFAKLETVNPTGSIKDRLIQHVVFAALERGDLTKSTVMIEATSGNTGISLSAIGAALGLKVKIIMPENMSAERKQMMRAFGAEIIYVGRSDFLGAIELRNQMASKPGYWSPMQFENIENIECHAKNTAMEIIDQLPYSRFDAFVSGAGTGGTIMGVRMATLYAGLETKMVLVKPAEPACEHGIQGINDGADFLARPDLLDYQYEIPTAMAMARAETFAKERGVLVGISAGANLLAAENYIKKCNPAGAVVTILCDRGERYLS